MWGDQENWIVHELVIAVICDGQMHFIILVYFLLLMTKIFIIKSVMRIKSK